MTSENRSPAERVIGDALHDVVRDMAHTKDAKKISECVRWASRLYEILCDVRRAERKDEPEAEAPSYSETPGSPPDDPR